MKIAILGSGLMGAKLGRLWATCGHDVTFAYSRDRAKLDRLAKETGGAAGSVREAVDDAGAVLLAVHWSRTGDVLEQAGDLAGQVVLNCCVPLNDDDSALVLSPGTSGAEELARMRPDARWVSCFNTSPSESFELVFARKDTMPRPHLMFYGDDDAAKDVAGSLISDIGFEPLDAGGLSTGRYAEPFAMVTAVLAYGQPGGPALTYRFNKLR
ncbi:transmembrane reductase oxidoreductase [Mesobaculum littorinae]|uniref:Transmembrane reductase oxidoreductase n=1 Tax=Mesobaculum littorinae TaxID=2486419 RepID=A0A438AK27_9RHOB|nr:NAD(P)-binding domain-containing protein [Mesobaculum littorinae]RVV99032.1 transmembrane reductase oxidoreductase [Mesobaculum littorinae]